MNDGSTFRTAGRAASRGRSLLVVAQLALGLALLIVSGLVLRAMHEVNRAPLGFDPANLLTITIDVPAWKYPTVDSVRRFQSGLLDRLASLPGARSAASTDRLPVVSLEAPTQVSVEGRDASRLEDRPWAIAARVSERYFETARIPLLAGRAFAASDNESAMPVAVINDEMAARHWGDRTAALNRRLRFEGDERWFTVVGVSGDVLRADFHGSDPELYVPALQVPSRSVAFMVRTEPANRLVQPAREAVRAVDPDVPVAGILPFENLLSDQLSGSRIVTGLFVAFAVLALGLAASGLYGVVSYSVTQRRREIGIRMALGAAGSDVGRMIVRQTLTLVVAGGVIGLAGGASLGKLSASLLFGVSPTDPRTYGAAVGILSLVAFVAAYAPVRRAASVDPLVALRSE